MPRGVEDFSLGHMGADFARTQVSRHETVEHGDGRQEHRTSCVCAVPEGLPDARRWKGRVRIGMAVGETVRGGKPSDAVRYYIMTRRPSARRFGRPVRGHRGIENSLRWQPEVNFGEEQSRTRRDHAQAVLGVLPTLEPCGPPHRGAGRRGGSRATGAS